jgi:hypothetical protein
MTKRAWIYLGVSAVFSVASLAVIGAAMFWPLINPLSWDFALLVASCIFLISSGYLVAMCSRHWLEIWPVIGQAVATFFLTTSIIVFIGSLVMIFLPEGCKIVSNQAINIIMLWSLFIMVLSSWHFTP